MMEARELVQEFSKPKAWIYWSDLLFHAALGWGCFIATLLLPAYSPWKLVSFPVSALALYRTAIFVHELAHLPKDSFQVFRWVWTAVGGVPLQIPSFVYTGVHSDHHRPGIYGTREDGEYVPYGAERRWKIVLHLLSTPLLPFVLVARFLVLAPLSYLHPRLRGLLWERLSSLTIDFGYRRSPPGEREGEYWQLEEGLAGGAAALAVTLTLLGVIDGEFLVLWYLVAVVILFLNALRTLVAHRYLNPPDRGMTISQQFLDSVDVPGHRFWTALWAPVGLRYHATHHLFPFIPYHDLGKAHRKLAREFSARDLYLQSTRSGLLDAFRALWRRESLDGVGMASEGAYSPRGGAY